jgi:TRAP-type C4-dicarboxylate transport system permease small subunit
VISVIGAVSCAYVASLGYDITERVYTSGQRMSSLPLLRAWFYLPVPICFGLMSVAFVQTLLAGLTGIRLPDVADFGPRDGDSKEGHTPKEEH